MSNDSDKEKSDHCPTKIRIDDQGRSVWADAVETAQFELVSTQQLQALLASDDDKSRHSIEAAATNGDDGVLVRDVATGLFKIIDDFDIQAMLDDDQEQRRKSDKSSNVTRESVHAKDPVPAEPLALVSTQLLRTVLSKDPDAKPNADDSAGGGCDPYNSS